MASDDVGTYVVDQIYRRLMIDAQWSLRGPRGFTWWSYRLAQHVEASVPVVVGGRDVCEIRIWTEVVNRVDPASPVAEALTMPNMHATLSASVWDQARSAITDHCTAIVHRQNADWMSWLLPVAAIMQNTAAHTRAHALAEAVNGAPAESSHLSSGPRPEADELLTAPERVIAPAGKQPSGFIGERTRRLAHVIGASGFPGFAEDTVLTCEMPFTGAQSTTFLSSDEPVESALLEVYPDVEHPDYGAGALMTLALPLRFAPDDVAGIANRLNVVEARSALPVDAAGAGGGALGVLLGAWSPDPRVQSRDRIAFNSFVPTVLARPWLLENLVRYQEIRCRFAAQALGIAEPGATALWRDVAERASADPDAAERRFIASAKADLAVRVMREAASQVGEAPAELQATSWRSLVSSRPNDWRPNDAVLSDDDPPTRTGDTPGGGSVDGPPINAPAATPDKPRSPNDVGIQLMFALLDLLMVDAAWVLPRERGFTWWSYRLAQHVEIGPPVSDGEVNLCSVRIWTEVVRDVDPARHLAQQLGMINAEPTLSALVWRPETREIVECCTATVHEQNLGWLSQVLATAAAMQNADAHARCEALAQACGGVPATSQHRLNGHRPMMDDVLDMPRDVVARAGDHPSHYAAGALMGRVEPFLAQMGFYGSAAASGMTCEVPYTGSTPAVILAERGAAHMETSLVQIFTDTPHPQFGNGATLTMKLPATIDPSQVAQWANWLNTAEAQGDSHTPLLGAWCPDPDSDSTLAFHSFLPNAIATPGTLENHIAYQATRSRFAAQHVGG